MQTISILSDYQHSNYNNDHWTISPTVSNLFFVRGLQGQVVSVHTFPLPRNM